MLFLEYPPCTTCKKAKAWLQSKGLEFTARHIKEENPTAEELSVEREEPAKVAQEPKKSTEKKPKLSLLRKKGIDNSEKSAYIDFKKTHSALSADEQRIVSALESGQRLVDDVIAELELAPGVILASLTMLEIKGFVLTQPGGWAKTSNNH